MFFVKLGKKISGEKLEGILKEAAKELGFGTHIYDKHDFVYILDGSVEAKKVYDKTIIKLAGVGFNTVDIEFFRNEDVDSFSIKGSEAAKNYVEEYLTEISKKLRDN